MCVLVARGYDRVYSTPLRIEAGEMMLDSVAPHLENLELNYRVRIPSNREQAGKATPAWEVVWDYRSPDDYCGLALTWVNSDFGAISDRRFLRAELIRVTDGHREVVDSKEFDKKVNLADGFNSVSVSKWEDRMYVAVGAGSEYLQVGEMPYYDGDVPVLAGLIAHRPVEIVRARLTAAPLPEAEMVSFTEQSLRDYLIASHDPMEGCWVYLDRKTDPDAVVMGGTYTIAVVKDTKTGQYVLIYLSGAGIHSSNWQPMRVKGRLSRTGFVGNYDLQWLDADGHPVSSECYATISDGALLTLVFPLLRSEIRFRKVTLQ